MSHVLLSRSSLFGDQSKSAQIAEEFVAAWRRAHPGAVVTERVLTPALMPHLSSDALGALITPPEQRTTEQAKSVAFADRLIEELEAADTIVLAVPMYNFPIPSTLKAWIDHVARAGRTFRYAASGPEGLLKGKKVVAITGRGGPYTGDSSARSLDFQGPYLRGVLGFLGLTDISFIHIEGLKVSPETAEKGIARARAAIAGTIEALAEAA